VLYNDPVNVVQFHSIDPVWLLIFLVTLIPCRPHQYTINLWPTCNLLFSEHIVINDNIIVCHKALSFKTLGFLIRKSSTNRSVYGTLNAHFTGINSLNTLYFLLVRLSMHLKFTFIVRLNKINSKYIMGSSFRLLKCCG